MTSTNRENQAITLEEFIIQSQNEFPGATGELSQLLRDIGLAAKIISREVNKAGITNILGYHGSKNIHGESVKKLDLFSDKQLISALSRSDITCMVISEENDGIVELENENGKYIVYMDPLDGSSNIDVNVSIGSIFSIYLSDHEKGVQLTKEHALKRGTEQVAAGYVLYGSSTIMVYTTGMGVSMFTLDPSIGEFMLSKQRIKIPEFGATYSVNEGYYKSWPTGLKKYVKYCQVEDEATNRPYSTRYIGSMVADVHRTLHKGGIFIYPHSNTYPNGKLRLMYECNPLSLVIEQAGGMAINGKGRILEIKPEAIHQRTPIYIGSKENVMKVKGFLKEYAEAPVEA